MYSVFEVADWFLSKESMSPKKLQKLVYYAYAWTLTLMNEEASPFGMEKLFEDSEPEAWVHGPVFPHLYHKYKNYGYRSIEKKQDFPKFDDDIEDILEQVWQVYGQYTANELESISHQESSWIEARGNCSAYSICSSVISDESIFNCYAERLS